MNQELYNEAGRSIAVALPVVDVPRLAAERGADQRVCSAAWVWPPSGVRTRPAARRR